MIDTEDGFCDGAWTTSPFYARVQRQNEQLELHALLAFAPRAALYSYKDFLVLQLHYH